MKDYKDDDKFRCLQKDIQIVFSNDTRIIDMEDDEVMIDHCAFDFYDIGDLKQLFKQTTYLTGIILLCIVSVVPPLMWSTNLKLYIN